MEVLELVVEKSIGKEVLARHSKLKSALRKVDKRGSTRTGARSTEEERQRVTAIIELCFEYRREIDPEERQNILRTLDEIAANQPIELPSQNVEQWDEELAARDRDYAKLREKDEARVDKFLRKYSSLKHRAGFRTQAEVAKAAGIGRTQIAVLESGKHMPQQKTLQKLATAFGVDVADLM
jgi:DNA-binding XRE family transcriptional regulator